MKTFEYFLVLIVGNSDSGVPNCKGDGTHIVGLDIDANGAAGICELNGVVQQVDQPIRVKCLPR